MLEVQVGLFQLGLFSEPSCEPGASALRRIYRPARGSLARIQPARASLRLALLLLLFGAASRLQAAEPSLRVEVAGHKARVSVGEELFALYRNDLGPSPMLWPLIGPTGKRMTRHYPAPKPTDGSGVDHPWHRSAWIAHQRVNGLDFWHDPNLTGTQTGTQPTDSGRVVPTATPVATVETDARGVSMATLTARHGWVANTGATLLQDTTTYRFQARSDWRTIDVTWQASPVEGPVTFGDAKDGTFALRVPESMAVDSGLGGAIVNDRGERDAAAWGRPASWVDYNGPVGGETVGVALMSHPSNPRPRPRWHVRTYGLFAMNPFGESEFDKVESYRQGAVTIPLGETLTIRYRILLHAGDQTAGRVADSFLEFCKL